MEYLLSRQPIFKSKVELAGYEIRSRAVGEKAEAGETEDASRATFSLLSGAGLEHIVGQYLCFINLTPQAVHDELWNQLPSDNVVLGFFDEFNPSDPVAAKLKDLIGSGVRVALSGNLNPHSLEAIGSEAYALKLNVTSMEPGDLEKKFGELKGYKVPLLADCVDTYDDLEFCRMLGFDLYQGRFISRSASAEEKDIPVNRLAMMRIMSKLHDPKLAIPDLGKLISLDAALSYKLLSYANSAAVALPRNVSSIDHAVRLIGLDRLRTWATVLLLSTVEEKPRELMTIALVRARMCELLSGTVKNAEKDSYFSAGLLSVIDALLDTSMEKAVAGLPLTGEVKSALISKSGSIGQALRCTVAYENADWDEVQFYGMSPGPIRDAYVQSIGWARELTGGLLQK
jgi:c-di-GMP phosphodiesterase